MFKKSAIITKLLILTVAALLGSEMQELLSYIAGLKQPVWLNYTQMLLLVAIIILAALLRKAEISLIKQFESEKERLYQDKIWDISEKLADEERLLREYKDAIDSSAIVSKADKTGVITYVNDKFCEVTGYHKYELIGQTYRPIRHPDNDREFFRKMWLILLSKKTYAGKIKNMSKNGNTFVVEATISPILNSNGEIEEFIAIMFDVTKEVLLEKKLRDRAAKEQEESYKDELSKAKDSFLLVFTHELKTPLNAIINFASFVKKKIEKEDIQDKDKLVELLASVKQNGEDMLLSVTNMLDTAKLKSNKMVFADSIFDLGELLFEIKHKILPPTGVKCKADIAKSVFIKTDRLRMGQIISNIISNAVKYGNGQIYISLQKDDEQFMLCIEDDGVGIKNKDAIFQLFGEGGADITRSTKGTGIGLYYAKTLCDEFGLKLAFDNGQKLAGTRFCITGGTTNYEA
ncbi:MAG: PAS domain S-box protein [Campylobacterales bacterium]